MNVTVRIAAALVLLGGLASVGVWLSGGGGGEQARQAEPAAELRRWQSATECRDCHRDVWDEWYGSHHQIAYLNPEVRAQSDDFRNKECQACHLPQPISITGFGMRTLPRKTRPDEGVGCIECHIDVDGRVMGARSVPDAPCAPKASADLVAVEHCQSCHNQHKTTDQWRASHYAAEGIGCNDCHMPQVERPLADGTLRMGRSHVYPGAHDTDMLRRAGTFTASVDGRMLVLTLENSGAGHAFPTEERHRAVDIVYRFVGADGSTGEWQQAWRFRMPYRDEPGEDTQLPAGQTKSVEVPIPDGAVGAEARLWYRLQPYIGDEHPASTLLFERKVEIP